MSKIAIDDATAKKLALALRNFLFNEYVSPKLRGGEPRKFFSMYFYTQVFEKFCKGLDYRLAKKSDWERFVIIAKMAELDPEEPAVLEEGPIERGNVEYILLGTFLQYCVDGAPYNEDAVEAVRVDVASRIYTLLCKGNFGNLLKLT